MRFDSSKDMNAVQNWFQEGSQYNQALPEEIETREWWIWFQGLILDIENYLSKILLPY